MSANFGPARRSRYVGVPVGVGVGVGVRVGLGVGEEESDADDESDAEGEADLDAFGLADAVGDTDGRGSNVGIRAGVRRVSGSGDREARGLDGSARPAAGRIGSPDAIWSWAARARTPCRPATVTSVALIAATIHTATAAAAVAPPGLARIL